MAQLLPCMLAPPPPQPRPPERGRPVPGPALSARTLVTGPQPVPT
jgi:hypothetical protein